MKLWHSITPQSKRNSKLIKDLNGGAITLNLLRKTRLKPLWLKPQPVLFESTSQSNVKSNKGQQKDFSDLKSICTASASLKERNSQPLEWEKKFATHFKNKEFLCKTCKQLMQLSMERNNQPDRKTGQRSKWIFVLRGQADGHESHEKMLRMAVRELPLKTGTSYQLTPLRMAIFEKIYKD